MDIFSLGCVIAELFLEGTHIFNLAQLFKYRKGDYIPSLEGIENEYVKQMITQMISLDPKDRKTASHYLTEWKHKLFPDYFYDFLYDFVANVSMTNQYDNSGKPFKPNLFLDNRMSYIYNNFTDITTHLGFRVTFEDTTAAILDNNRHMLPNFLELPGTRKVIEKQDLAMDITRDDGALIVLSIVLSTIRNVSNSSLKIKGCDLIIALGEMINDDAKLDRCLPYFLTLLDDPSELVQASAIRNMIKLLGMVTTITPLNGEIFLEYIFPKLDTILRSNPKKSIFVRVMYASCFPSLAQIALRFLEMSQILKTSGMFDSYDPETENGSRFGIIPFDLNRQGLIEKFEEHTIALLSDEDTSVKKAILREVVPLCLFFGKQKTNDIVLSHILTYLNDPDYSLKTQFFDSIIGLGPFIGPIALEEYIQPLTLQALNDTEEFVIAKTFEAYKAFAELGLIREKSIWSLLEISVRYTVHPNLWIRNAAVSFVSSSTTWMSASEIYCMLYPILRPYLENDITEFSQANITLHIKQPLSRSFFNWAVTWASKAQKSIFWKSAAKKAETDKYSSDQTTTIYLNSTDKILLSSEDQVWVGKLKKKGGKEEDLWKIKALEDHIYKLAAAIVSTQKPLLNDNTLIKGDREKSQDLINNFTTVESLGIKPDRYKFTTGDYDWDNEDDPSRPISKESSSDALLNLDGMKSALKETVVHVNQASKNDSIASNLLSDHFGDQNGATAEPSVAIIGTSTTQAYGTVEQPFSTIQKPPSTPSPDFSSNLQEQQINVYVSKFLSAQNVIHGKTEPAEFGPQVIPVLYAENFHSLSVYGPTSNWRPSGVLASRFVEHTAAVNKIVPSPDHSFFLSCSDDGSIKIWDCARLEKNVINRSIQTISYGSETKVKFICFMVNSYTIAASLSTGKIAFIRVDVSLLKNASRVRFKKFVPLKTFDLQEGEYATWMKHVKTNRSSVLIITTTTSRIIGINVSTLKEDFSFSCPLNHGVPTCFIVDYRKCWMLVGTQQGVLDLYDLRFNVLAKSWTFENATPIYSLDFLPRSKERKFCMLGGTSKNEVTIWDVTNMTCHGVYTNSASIDQSKNYSAINFEELTTEKHKTLVSKQFDIAPKSSDIFCMAVGIDSKGNKDDEPHIHILSGGADRKVRFWDLNSVNMSTIVSGLTTNAKPPTFFQAYNNFSIKVLAEKSTVGEPQDSSDILSNTGTKTTRPLKPTRTAVIAAEQQDLARNHSASITDIAILHRPYQMVISADITGVIRVYI